MNNAIVFMCKEINKNYQNSILFYQEHADKYSYDVYICVDIYNSYAKIIQEKFKNIKILNISSDACIKNGFFNLIYLTCKKHCTSWDKSFFYFCNINKKYDNVWFIEDDVFLPDSNIIYFLDNKYKNYDFLCERFFNYKQNHDWCVWKFLIKRNIRYKDLKKIYSCGPIPITRLSKKMLTSISKFLKKKKKIYFIEIFLPNLCVADNMKYIKVEEFNLWISNYFSKVELLEKNKILHPVKNIKEHTTYRNIIKNMV